MFEAVLSLRKILFVGLYKKPPWHQKWSEMKWKSLSCVRLFANPWTIHGILQAGILEWVGFPFSRGSSQPRDWTHVSLIAGRFFTNWANRKAQWLQSFTQIKTIGVSSLEHCQLSWMKSFAQMSCYLRSISIRCQIILSHLPSSHPFLIFANRSLDCSFSSILPCTSGMNKISLENKIRMV